MAYFLDLLTSFRGRISRKAWWTGFIITFAANLLGGLIINPQFYLAEELPPPYWPDTLWQIAWWVPATAITVKRLHDCDWPGWLGYPFAAIGVAYYVAPHIELAAGRLWTPLLVPLVVGSAGFLVLVFIFNGFVRGTPGPNRYGPDPLAVHEIAA